MSITVQPGRRSVLAVFVAQLAWPLIFLLSSVAFTVSIFLIHTSQAYDNATPGCLANGEAIFPWNETVNEYWNPRTALFITLGSGGYTYPEAKAIDVVWDLLVGRAGQFLAAMFVWRVIRKSLYLSMEEKPVPVALAFGVYFHAITFDLLGSILENLTLPFRSRKHSGKGVSTWRLLGWLYACVYVLVLPTIVSAMTGYQTKISLFFHPLNSPSESLVGVTTLAPNPALVIRDGSRVGLQDRMAFPAPDRWAAIDTSGEDLLFYRYNQTYSTVLGYYFAMQALFYNSTWIPSTSGGTYPTLALDGPVLSDLGGKNQWEYCTVSLGYGDLCQQRKNTSQASVSPPKDAPRYPDPEYTWSNITLDNKTYVLQPPPLDIVWSGPARSWSISLDPDNPFAGYYSNGSIAKTAMCQPSSQYQWGFSSILLFFFCCLTILFAATILGLEWDVYQHCRSIRYKQSRNSYRDAVYVVEALRECFGDDTIRTDPHQMDSHVRSWTGGMQVKTLDLPPARSTWRSRSSNRNKLPDIPLLDQEAAERSVTETDTVAR